MSKYITIDGGTTNTRINLVCDKKIIESVKLNVGSGKQTKGENLLKTEIKYAIEKLLSDNLIEEKDIECILTSGMITSEFGLYKLDHINTPAGLNQLHQSMEKVVLKEISDIPFVFIRGVKTCGELFESCDVMRGEETEFMGLINSVYGNCVYVLPGSHSKIIKTNSNGEITDFCTMLTGEMIASLSQNTILKDAVDLSESKIDNKYLLMGYEYCKTEGINKALFKVRILKNTFNCTKDETYSFFVGIVLCAEIDSIVNCDAETIVIGGRSQLKNAMYTILTQKTTKNIVKVDDISVDLSTSLGAIRIYENIL